jgi:TonB family protein
MLRGNISTKILTLFGCVALLLRAMAQTPTGRDPLDEQAVHDFRQAVAADPNNVKAHLNLGSALEQQVVPGSQSPENLELAGEARAEFEQALVLDPVNLQAASSIASLFFRVRKLDEAEEWNKKVIVIDPNNKEAYFTLGMIAWARFLPVLLDEAPVDSNRSPAGLDSIADAALRGEVRAKWLPVLDAGIASLDRALQIDPNYVDAMTHMSLLIRNRGDLLDTPAERSEASAQADAWMQRAQAVKREKTASSPPRRPTPPPPGLQVDANVLSVNLISRVEPVYPPLARQARISGTVRFKVTVGVDGRIKNVQLVSGHPLLVQAAKEALAGYVYQPTLLNGGPVEVSSTVEVPFSLNP